MEGTPLRQRRGTRPTPTPGLSDPSAYTGRASTTHTADSVRKTVHLNECGGFADDVRQVKQHATWARMALENRGQQIAGTAANIDNSVEPGEVVGHRDRWRLAAVEADHSLVEVRRFLGVLSK